MLFPGKKFYTSAISTGLAAFAVYFCMYAFRKPFTVAKFDELELWGIDYKIILIISQVLGYALSKFLGIKIISGLHEKHRVYWIVGSMSFAGISLLCFALTSFPYNFVFMFLNGIPLGLIWGLVFAYLEGRRSTEIMAAMLSASFILASGMVKSAGKWLMQEFNLSEFWMPFATAMLFLIPLAIFVFLLQRTPPPTAEDIAMRKARQPMSSYDRKKLFSSMAPGLVVLILLYMFITAFRDFRDNFSVEVWEELGVINNARIFTQSEIPIALIILTVFAFFFVIRNNYRAFKSLHFMILSGMLCIAMSNLLFQTHIIQSPLLWTILTGTGLYMAYFPYNSMLFDRLIAAHQGNGNAGFLIYLADSFGYLGSILILLFKEFYQTETSYLHFLISLGYVVSFLGIGAWIFTNRYFSRKLSEEINSKPELKIA